MAQPFPCHPAPATSLTLLLLLQVPPAPGLLLPDILDSILPQGLCTSSSLLQAFAWLTASLFQVSDDRFSFLVKTPLSENFFSVRLLKKCLIPEQWSPSLPYSP